MGRSVRLAKALIIGGSIAGLFAAGLLARRGWDAEVFERVGVPLAGRGAGIVTHPEFARPLAAAGIDARHNLDVDVPGRRTLDRAGRIVAEHARPQTLTSWERLYRLLRERLVPNRYHLGRELCAFEQGERVTAHFSDGTSAEGDLLVGADGFRSTVRSILLPAVRPHYAGYVAWRGLVPEASLSPDAHAAIFGHFAFCLPPREQMLGYPVAGPGEDMRAGHRSYNYVWYRAANEQDELPRLLTDPSGRLHELSIPPPLIRAEALEDIRAAGARGLAPQFRELVAHTAQPILQPIYDLETPQMAEGRVALIGDAAFAARPHVGAGVAKAALDALALADALDSARDVESALSAFEAERLPVGRRIVGRARELGAYLEGKTDWADDPMSRADAIMAETAVLDFLR